MDFQLCQMFTVSFHHFYRTCTWVSGDERNQRAIKTLPSAGVNYVLEFSKAEEELLVTGLKKEGYITFFSN